MEPGRGEEHVLDPTVHAEVGELLRCSPLRAVVARVATLAALAARKPERVEDLLEVRGIGQKKAETYGKAFLEAIAAYAPANMP